MNPIKLFSRISLLLLATFVMSSAPAHAQIRHWNSQVAGDWSNAANWSPIGVPGAGDFALIGSLPGVQNHDSYLDADRTINGMIITDGMRVHLEGHSLQSTLDTLVSGLNDFSSASLLDINQGGTFTTRDLIVEDEGGISLRNNSTLNVNRALSLESGTFMSAAGVINLNRNGPNSFVNGGDIRVWNGDLTINQLGTGLIDLDGTQGSGNFAVGLGNYEDVLTINGTQLADSFSGNLRIETGGILNMNLSGGWTADANSQIDILDSGNGLSKARIQGGPLTLAGTVNVFRSETAGSDFAATTGQFGSAVAIQESASVDISADSTLEFAGSTTINGGNFTLGQKAKLNFSGATTILGGEFSTQSSSQFDGVINFNGPTLWNGTVNIDGIARQTGDASVTGTTTINAGALDMDGLSGSTSWTIAGRAVVNASRINSLGNEFFGEINIGGGFLHRLTMNLDNPWLMAGNLNLTGDNNFFVSRYAGSRMWVYKNLNLVSGRAQIDSDITLTGASTINLTETSSQLRLMGDTYIQSGVEMMGDGQLRNGMTGQMIIENGTNFSHVGLFNEGILQIGNPDFGFVGVATVDRFENAESGIWQVEIGGLMAGSEHDLLLVSGGPTWLGGMLDVDLIDLGSELFLPTIGDEFTILYSFGNVSGSFLSDPVSQYGDQLFHWSVDYHPHDVTLRLASITSAVPEPSVFGVALMAGLLVGGRRRRRHV